MSRKRSAFFTWRGAILESDLPATTRHVLLTLACHMNDAGEECYPSITRLCQETALSKQTVITHLKHAADLGWIEVETHGFGDRRWARNEYRIRWLDEDDGGQPAGPPPGGDGGQAARPPQGDEAVNLFSDGGQPNHREAVKEVDLSTSGSTPESTPKGLDLAAWRLWLDYRRKTRKPLKPVSIPAAQRKLAAFGCEQMAVVQHSIANGYQGLFAPKGGGGGNGRRRTFDDYDRELTRRIEETERESSAIPGTCKRLD